MGSEQELTSIYQILGISSNKSLNDLIEDKKEELSISSDRQLSTLLGINNDTLNRILNGENQKVDLISIIKISSFLELNIEETVKVYISTLKPEALAQIEETKKANYIVKNFDLDGLKKIGFIKTKTDFKYIEKRILDFFDIESVFDYSDKVAAPLFSKGKRASSDLMNDFWVKSAYSQLEKIDNPNEFNFQDFKKLIPKIRPYTRLESVGFQTVVRALYVVGVTVIVQKYVSKTSVKGATFIVNGNPCIIITDYYGKYDMMWFTLFHELCHVYYDLEDLKRNQLHLSGASDLLLLNEDRANLFARAMLFSDEKLKYIESNINNPYAVSMYAEEHGIHPSIIYGFYIHDQDESIKRNLYKKFSKHLISSEVALKSMKSNIWTSENPKEEIKQIIENISS
ncbi:ImmA/IrrE family metallo-endopeptidase [Lacinutrix iliipiscaria]|uniref:ImmA/IrrE family metallo-endopeptidase n=1 Tax=Lacinutrix iliipiscaria TaxID=1230532 RepID=A0ABW5WPM4_9FLAO